MATVNVLTTVGLDMLDADIGDLYYADSYAATSTYFKAIWLNGNEFDLFTGFGLTYNQDGEPVSGTVTGYKYYYYGYLVEISGASIPATLVASFARAGNTLGAFQYVLSGNDALTGNLGRDVLYGFGGNDTLSGGSGNDKLIGNAGNDTLNGGAGNDKMIGGKGNDVYFVNSANDVVTELSAQGSDLIRSSISYSLADTDGAGSNGGNIEKLTLTGTNPINGTGNVLANTLRGNSAANKLIGKGGNDKLVGNAGNDTLDGGAGNDKMIGGKGNDVYFVNSTSDVVTELPAQGSDLIKSSISYSLADTDGAGSNGGNIEKLTLTGANPINGTGNVLANTLSGNPAANKLTGKGGNDKLIGNAGNDKLIGNTGNDTLLGGQGNDLLRGGAGNDTLTGGRGDDIFRFDTTLGTGNIDKIADFNGSNDMIVLENAIFTELTATGALSAANYRENLTGTAVDGNDYILYETDTGRLYYDSNGSAAGERVQIATLWDSATTHPTGAEIGFDDFLIV